MKTHNYASMFSALFRMQSTVDRYATGIKPPKQPINNANISEIITSTIPS